MQQQVGIPFRIRQIFLLLCVSSSIVVSGCGKVSSPPPNGHETAAWFIDQYGSVNTPALQECLQRMQARMRVAIATITNRDPGLFVVRVFNYREPLAFSAIGGEILLSKGLILTVEEEDELAAVVAHEISHHLLGHLESLKSEAGRSPSFVFSQETEEAADELSVSILSAAGYDPLASMKALRKLTSSEQRMHREQVLANALANIQQQSLSPKTGRNRLFERVQAEVAGMEQIRPMRDGPLRDWDSQ